MTPGARLCGPHNRGASAQGRPPVRLTGRATGLRGRQGAPRSVPVSNQGPLGPQSPACVPVDTPQRLTLGQGTRSATQGPQPYLRGHQAGRVVGGGILHDRLLLGRLLHRLRVCGQSMASAPPAGAMGPQRHGCLKGQPGRSQETRPPVGTGGRVRTQGPPAPLGLPAGTNHIQLGDVQELQTNRSPSALAKAHQASPGPRGACAHLHTPLLPQGRPGRWDGRAVPGGAEDAGGGGAPEGCLLRDAFEWSLGGGGGGC